MKVGQSLSKCVRDIFEGRVDYKDVLVIISRTDFDPNNDNQWKSIWNGYLYGGASHPVWHGLGDHEEEIRNICIDLYESGKLHQPRQYDSSKIRLSSEHTWLETILSDDDLQSRPAVKDAWERFQVVAGLAKR